MNESELVDFRRRLLELKTELEDLQVSAGAASRPVELDQASVGRLSRMDAMQAQQTALETARRRSQRLLKIAGALKAIESGDYGYCHVCGEGIDSRRLATDLTHTRCIKCAE